MINHAAYQALPRVALLSPTPLLPLPTLGAFLGGIQLYVKRDDLGAIGGGGNKLRKLELLVAQAQRDGADTLITFGALQSNHARLTAAVAAQLGLACHLILSRKVPRSGAYYEACGNLTLNRLLGAQQHFLDADADPLAFAATLQAQLRAQGRRPAMIAFGGSDALGSLGHVRCIEELVTQSASQGMAFDHLVHASGSGGTQAGLVLGAQLCDAPFAITGISVLHPAAALTDIVQGLVHDAAALLGIDGTAAANTVRVDDRFVGPGYGLATPDGLAAMALAARREALLLDPVYTGKAFAGLLALAREGQFRAGERVVFLHTGGLPGVFAYADDILAADALDPDAPAAPRATP